VTEKNYFAQDPTVLTGVSNTLAAMRSAQPELYWSALIDSAFDYPGAAPAPYSAGALNCYDAEAFEGLRQLAPCLVPLPEDDHGVARLLWHCRERPMLSILASTAPPAALVEAWLPLHWVHDDDNQRMLLRVADTRVVPVLARVLTPAQWAAWTASIAHWLIIDRSGQLVTCSLAEQSAAPETSIQLTRAQLDQMILAAEPDAIIDLLAQSMPDVLPATLPKSQLYGLIAESCALAHRCGVEVYSDIVALAVAACISEGRSNQNGRLPALLRAAQWAPGGLGELLLDEAIA
jgi:hypothetical protein